MQKLIGLWILSLLVVAALSAVVTAQINRTAPRIVSGDDLGFRIEGTDRLSGKPVGTLMIRVNGDWVEVGSGFSTVPATR